MYQHGRAVFLRDVLDGVVGHRGKDHLVPALAGGARHGELAFGMEGALAAHGCQQDGAREREAHDVHAVSTWRASISRRTRTV
jgi:hypothetical protein